MQPNQTPLTAPLSVPPSVPKKMPVNVAALKLKMAPSVLATLSAAGVLAQRPRPTDAAEEDALLGLKPAAAAVAAPPPPKVRRVERAPVASSSSSSSLSSSSEDDSSSDDSSDSDSADSSDARSTASAVSEDDAPLFEIARSQGLVSKDVLAQVEEEEDMTPAVPPRPPIVRSFPSDIEKTLARYHEKLNREENLIRMKDDNKAVSLGTSKINYIDPRIVCSWAKAQDVPINKIFSATIVKKFPWAMNAEKFDF